MSNDIGSVKGINGYSTCLNNQPGYGTAKPMPMGGKENPEMTKPSKPADVMVPMTK